MLAGVACVPKQGKTKEVCSDVHEHKLEVTAMAAGTSNARTMAMRRNETREGDVKYRGFTEGFSGVVEHGEGVVESTQGRADGDAQEEVDEDALREEDVADPACVDANVVEGDDGEAAWGGPDGDDMRTR